MERLHRMHGVAEEEFNVYQTIIMGSAGPVDPDAFRNATLILMANATMIQRRGCVAMVAREMIRPSISSHASRDLQTGLHAPLRCFNQVAKVISSTASCPSHTHRLKHNSAMLLHKLSNTNHALVQPSLHPTVLSPRMLCRM